MKNSQDKLLHVDPHVVEWSMHRCFRWQEDWPSIDKVPVMGTVLTLPGSRHSWTVETGIPISVNGTLALALYRVGDVGEHWRYNIPLSELLSLPTGATTDRRLDNSPRRKNLPNQRRSGRDRRDNYKYPHNFAGGRRRGERRSGVARRNSLSRGRRKTD